MSRLGVFLLSLLWALLAQAEPTLQASVDRARLEAGETLELTLESQDVTQFGKPDLRALEGDFEVRGTRQHALDHHPAATTQRQPAHPRVATGPVAKPAHRAAGAASRRQPPGQCIPGIR